MKKRTPFVIGFILLANFLSACQAPPTPEPTPTITPTSPPPTATPTPKPTLTPTPAPPPGQDLTSLCLRVNTSNHPNNLSGDIRRVLENVFGNYGMDILGGECEATLTITATFNTSSAEYKDDSSGKYVTCYTGESAQGEMIFEIPGAEPLQFEIDRTNAPPSGTIHTCPRQPEHALLADAWAPDVLDGLYQIFGPEVLAHMIFQGFAGGSPTPMYTARGMLIDLGAKAQAAAPVLLNTMTERYEDELPEFGPSVDAALAVLRAISGEDFKRDLSAWNAWWESQP